MESFPPKAPRISVLICFPGLCAELSCYLHRNLTLVRDSLLSSQELEHGAFSVGGKGATEHPGVLLPVQGLGREEEDCCKVTHIVSFRENHSEGRNRNTSGPINGIEHAGAGREEALSL